MKRFVVAALMPLVFLVGCGAEAPADDSDPPRVNPENASEVKIENGGYDVNVFTTTIDGVKCRVAVVYEAVSLDCEDENVTSEDTFQ